MTREQHIEKDWQEVAEHIRDLRNEPPARPVVIAPAQDPIDRVLPGAQWQRVRDAWREAE